MSHSSTSHTLHTPLESDQISIWMKACETCVCVPVVQVESLVTEKQLTHAVPVHIHHAQITSQPIIHQTVNTHSFVSVPPHRRVFVYIFRSGDELLSNAAFLSWWHWPFFPSHLRRVCIHFLRRWQSYAWAWKHYPFIQLGVSQK